MKKGINVKNFLIYMLVGISFQAQASGLIDSNIVRSRVTTTDRHISQMTKTAKTVTPNPIKPTKVVKAQHAMALHPVAGAPVASLNAPARVLGCQEQKQETKCNK